MPKRRHLEEMRSAWGTCAQYVRTYSCSRLAGYSRGGRPCAVLCALIEDVKTFE
jgi:hypothetical protein